MKKLLLLYIITASMYSMEHTPNTPDKNKQFPSIDVYDDSVSDIIKHLMVQHEQKQKKEEKEANNEQTKNINYRIRRT